MSARPLRNKAYLMIVVAAILMLATLLGGLALRRNMRERLNEAAPTADGHERRSQPGRSD